MNLSSDNAGPVHPRVMAALAEANDGRANAYGADPWTARAVDLVREALDAPEAAVHLVATGTAANSLALAALSRPWDTIFCADLAHAHQDEGNAPEFFTGGAKLTLVPSTGAKMTPDALRRAIAAEGTRGVHGPQRGPVSLSQATERGTVHSVAEVAALAAVARGFGLRLHMDGARLGNALAGTNAAAADMTWRAGVDALSFGGTKNGLLGVEAVVLFDPALSWELELRRKRAGHLVSKHRYLAAQMAAYLTDGLWLDMARAANEAAAHLARRLRALGAEPAFPPDANLLFLRLPRPLHDRLQAAGAHYHLYESPESGPVLARLVCDWSQTPAALDSFLDTL